MSENFQHMDHFKELIYTQYSVPVHVGECVELLQYLLVNAVVVDDLYLQLKVVRGASLRQALRLQVHMMDNLKEDQRNECEMRVGVMTPSLYIIP